jgi:hypothetical protein
LPYCRYRTNLKLWDQDYETVYVDGLVMAFTRGDSALVVLSGQVAKAHPEELPRIVALANLPRGMRGKTLRNIFDPNVSARAAAGLQDLARIVCSNCRIVCICRKRF